MANGRRPTGFGIAAALGTGAAGGWVGGKYYNPYRDPVAAVGYYDIPSHYSDLKGNLGWEFFGTAGRTAGAAAISNTPTVLPYVRDILLPR